MWRKFTPHDRLTTEELETKFLAPWACLSSEAQRELPEEDELRPAFQRDRDRILHSRAFRRLKHKTQVFVPHVADHQRTRQTHTLEVAQLGRTIARALALNEDLVEAIALGHDLGHTAFGHTGETVLDEILQGKNPELDISAEVAAEAGRFKHNYHSLRVVDLLERRYEYPGLNLTDEVREGILKHTGWKVDFAFPLHRPDSLRLEKPCHLEGQVVALADEIAQQTHDLEDGLRAGAVRLVEVEKLKIAARIPARPGEKDWNRQNELIRGMIAFFVSRTIRETASRLRAWVDQKKIGSRESWLEVRDEAPPTMVGMDREAEGLLTELKAFIYRFIINHPTVNRQDWRARKVMTALFKAFWTNPRILPTYLLLRVSEELDFPYLRDISIGSVEREIRDRYHGSPGFARLVVDHLAGMSDRFALEEYSLLEQPSAEQRFSGVTR